MLPPQHFQGQLILIYCNHASLPSVILLVLPGEAHFLIIQNSQCLSGYMYVYMCVCARARLVAQSCPTLWPHIPPCYSVYGNSPGKNTRVGCHVLLQGIFSTQGSNPGLLYCRQIIYHLSHQGSPKIPQSSSNSGQEHKAICPWMKCHCVSLFFLIINP